MKHGLSRCPVPGIMLWVLAWLVGTGVQAYGQEVAWESLTGPEGGTVYSLARQTNGQLLAGTQRGVVRRAGSQPWQRLSLSALNDSAVYGLVVTPAGDLYCGTGLGLYIQKNSTGTVSRVPDTLLHRRIRALAVLPTGRLTVVVDGFGSLTGEDTNWRPDSSYLHRLTGARCLAVSPGGHTLVAASDSIYIRQPGATRFTGTAWVTNTLPTAATWLNSCQALVFTQGQGVYYTSDCGATWVLRPGALAGLAVRSCFWDAQQATVYAGGQDGTIWASSDTAQTWSRVFTLPSQVPIHVMTRFDNIWSVGTGVYGLWQGAGVAALAPSNLGLGGLRARSLIAFNDRTLLASFDGAGLYRSTDAGTTWLPANEGVGSLQVNALHRMTDAQALAGVVGAGRLYLTADTGRTWVPVGLGLSAAFSVTALTTDSRGHWYAGTLNNGVYRSINNGQGWVNYSTTGLGSKHITALAVSPGDTLWAGVAGAGAAYWDDANARWQPRNTGLETATLARIGYARRGEALLAASNRGLHRYSPSQNQWISLLNAQFEETFTSLETTPRGLILAGSSRRGLLVSSDSGKTFTEENTNLTEPRFTTLAFAPAGVLFAGTSGYGIARTRTAFDLRPYTHRLPLAHQTLTVYPNPAQDRVFVRSMSVSVQTFVLTNLYGQLLRTYTVDHTSGIHTLSLEGIPAGVYYLRTETHPNHSQTVVLTVQ